MVADASVSVIDPNCHSMHSESSNRRVGGLIFFTSQDPFSSSPTSRQKKDTMVWSVLSAAAVISVSSSPAVVVVAHRAPQHSTEQSTHTTQQPSNNANYSTIIVLQHSVKSGNPDWRPKSSTPLALGLLFLTEPLPAALRSSTRNSVLFSCLCLRC